MIVKCEICGKEYKNSEEPYSHEYSDCVTHILNFADNEHNRQNLASNANSAVKYICLNIPGGNSFRSPEQMQELLNCYLKWEEPSEDIKKIVEECANKNMLLSQGLNVMT